MHHRTAAAILLLAALLTASLVPTTPASADVQPGYTFSYAPTSGLTGTVISFHAAGCYHFGHADDRAHVTLYSDVQNDRATDLFVTVEPDGSITGRIQVPAIPTGGADLVVNCYLQDQAFLVAERMPFTVTGSGPGAPPPAWATTTTTPPTTPTSTSRPNTTGPPAGTSPPPTSGIQPQGPGPQLTNNLTGTTSTVAGAGSTDPTMADPTNIGDTLTSTSSQPAGTERLAAPGSTRPPSHRSGRRWLLLPTLVLATVGAAAGATAWRRRHRRS